MRLNFCPYCDLYHLLKFLSITSSSSLLLFPFFFFSSCSHLLSLTLYNLHRNNPRRHPAWGILRHHAQDGRQLHALLQRRGQGRARPVARVQGQSGRACGEFSQPNIRTTKSHFHLFYVNDSSGKILQCILRVYSTTWSLYFRSIISALRLE